MENKEIVSQCSRQFQEKFYKKGEIIMRQGDPAKEFYIILKGKIYVYTKSVSVKESNSLRIQKTKIKARVKERTRIKMAVILS